MEKEESGGKNDFGAERKKAPSKLFFECNGLLLFLHFHHFCISISKWLLILAILSIESCLLLYLCNTGCL